jgi:uncharacterized membrane-anchored protein
LPRTFAQAREDRRARDPAPLRLVAGLGYGRRQDGSATGEGGMASEAAGGALGFTPHPLRAAVLGEVHARPFQLVAAPRVFLHLAFLTDAAGAAADRAAFEALCRAQGLAGPGPETKHLRIPVLGGRLGWEQHSEFITYTFEAAYAGDGLPPHPFGSGFREPGPVIAAARVDLLKAPEPLEAGLAGLDPVSLCVARVADGTAVAATDFRQDGDGFTRIRVFDLDLTPARAGALVQRLLEIETYRTLALLGLPEAQRSGPIVRRIEDGLTNTSEAMRASRGLDEDRRLLDELTTLAAALEADAAASAYRFGASRAYYEIVGDRLNSIREERIAAYGSFSGFLQRRLGPAMRTCQAIESRQTALATKLARAANLLRTRVDVEIERQNRDLLNSMNRRARLQLRLQQTVEGLSVAAISYYVASLVGYLAKGAKEAGVPVDPTIATAVAIPPVALGLWWLVRRIRRQHAEEDRTRG